jgi:Phosphotransferase enzyme family
VLDIESLARAALTEYDVEVGRMVPVSTEWNTTFRVETTDRAAYALRVYLPLRRSDEEIEREFEWLEVLADEPDLNVPRPVRALDGSAFVWADGSEPNERRRVAMFSWVPGRPLGDEPDPELVAAFGDGDVGDRRCRQGTRDVALSDVFGKARLKLGTSGTPPLKAPAAKVPGLAAARDSSRRSCSVMAFFAIGRAMGRPMPLPLLLREAAAEDLSRPRPGGRKTVGGAEGPTKDLCGGRGQIEAPSRGRPSPARRNAARQRALSVAEAEGTP